MEWMLHTFCNTERGHSAEVAIGRKRCVARRAQRSVAAVSDTAELVHAAERDVTEAELRSVIAVRTGFGAVDARPGPGNNIPGLKVRQVGHDGTTRTADESVLALARIARGFAFGRASARFVNEGRAHLSLLADVSTVAVLYFCKLGGLGSLRTGEPGQEESTPKASLCTLGELE